MLHSALFLAVSASFGASPPPADEIELRVHGGAGEVALAPHDPLGPAIHAAAVAFAVPEVLLQALVWEASRWDASVASSWAGYGPLDLREDQDPALEDAARLLGVSPDALIRDPSENIRGGAALLAREARLANAGRLPDTDDLESWWPAVMPFSGSHDPERQELFATYVFELMYYGVDDESRIGEAVKFGGLPIDLPALTGGRARMMPAGDYSGSAAYAQACCYSDYSRSPSDIKYVVIHTVQGGYSGCISWFQNCDSNVSAHYVVRSSDGQVTQMVYESDVAWHAGNWTYNTESVGIEHEGYVDDPDTWYTPAMYAGSAKLTADIVARTAVTADRSHIIGHVEVPGATHTDPGSGWDWDYYMSLVTGSSVVAGKLTGVIADSDIYNGARLVGADVWIEQTGESTSSNDQGNYTFADMPSGTYTVHAKAPGYAEGTCTKEITDSSTYWCSIALFPGEDPPEDTDPPDTGTPADTDVPTVDDTDPDVSLDGAGGPGDRLLRSEAGKKGCDTVPVGAIGAAWLLAFAIRRRR